MISARLDTTLCIPYLLEHGSGVLEVLAEQVFLLRNLRQEHSKLVADVTYSVVICRLTPVTELARYRRPLAACCFVRADTMALGFDEFIEFLGLFQRMRLERDRTMMIVSQVLWQPPNATTSDVTPNLGIRTASQRCRGEGGLQGRAVAFRATRPL